MHRGKLFGHVQFSFVIRTLVIVDELHVHRTLPRPHKANPPLIVDANRVLPLSITSERFQPVSRRSSQIAQRGCGIQIAELPPRDCEQIGGKSLRNRTFESSPRPLIFKALDHMNLVSQYDTQVETYVS